MRRSNSISTIAAIGLLMSFAGGAHAVPGVEAVHFGPAATNCNPEQPFSCEEGEGWGESNVVYVHQREVDGQHVFDSLEVPGIPAGHMWVAVTYGAECKFGYHIKGAAISSTAFQGSGKGDDPIQVNPNATTWTFASGGQKISQDVFNLWVPVDSAFDTQSVLAFDDLEDVFAYGENVIADRVAAGETEEEARAKSFEVDTYIGLHGRLRCKGNIFGREGWVANGDWIPLKFRFVGLGLVAGFGSDRPGAPTLPTNDFTGKTQVTQAFLTVAPDAQNSCRLRLTGAFVTTAMTDLTYRFVDELGRKSQTFVTTVDQTLVSMIDHYFDLPEPEFEDGEIDELVQPEEQEIGGKVVATPTGTEQGYFQVEVLEPHGYWSNIAGYVVAPCQPGIVGDTGGLTTPDRVPPGGYPGFDWLSR